MKYLRNSWYVAAWATELTDAPLSRTLLDEPVVMFRDSGGIAHALADRCPHRFVPLSRGRIAGDTIECPYHGLRFDGAGACVFNPQGAPPEHGRVASYPLTEKHGILWIWMGDRQADAGSIPDFSIYDPERSFTAGAYLHLDGNYQLATDNILDLSHIEFVHRDSINLRYTPAEREESAVRRIGDTIWSDRSFYHTRLSPALAQPHEDTQMLRDRWLNVRWNAPACMLLQAGTVPAGGDRALDDVQANHLHLFTPETAGSCHYWFGVTHERSRGAHFADIVPIELNVLRSPFADEDGPMLKAQQASLGGEDFWEARPMILAGDAAAIRVRRLLAKMMREEQGESEADRSLENAA